MMTKHRCRQPPWYANWFTEEYLQMYAHRGEDEAKEAIRFLIPFLPQRKILRIIDIACGSARHMIGLANHCIDHSLQIVGIDLSLAMLHHAQIEIDGHSPYPHLSPSLVCADMRIPPFYEGCFDVLLSMFTSFGYFSTDIEHQAMLHTWHTILQSEGLLVLDYLNKDFVIKALASTSVETTPSNKITQNRYITPDALRVVKHIDIENIATGIHKKFEESVRMYTSIEIQHMFNEAGFVIHRFFGNFRGDPFTPDSERLIVVAHAHH